MHISNSTFSAFVGSFTSNTAIMVVSTDPDVRVASTEMNVKLARPGASAFRAHRIDSKVLTAFSDPCASSLREVHQDACGRRPGVRRCRAIELKGE
jgi:hypothetical protein